MRRAERLFRLVAEMRRHGISRAADLARRLEVSTRTVYRDIAHLQASGLPIDGEAGVGYVLRPGFTLPGVTFTHEQVDALAVALSFAESVEDPDLARAAREVRAKLQAAMPLPETGRLTDAPFFALRPRARGVAQRYLPPLRQAVRKRRIVVIDYADGSGSPSHRRVRPLAIWTFPDGWMLSGWCELRNDFRTFRLDRITGLALTNEAAPDDASKNLRAFLASEPCDHAPPDATRLTP